MEADFARKFLAEILAHAESAEHFSVQWFKPAKGQFQLFYRSGSDHLEYQPDFVAEAKSSIFMLEAKATNQMTDSEVLAKKHLALQWCKHASDHAKMFGGKPWKYVLMPHDAVAENMTLEGLAERYPSH